MRIARPLVAFLLLALPATAAAQVYSPRPGSQTGTGLPEHIQNQLWPQRELSPTEQEFKDHVIVMVDTLGVLRATVAQAHRHNRGASSGAMLRSVSRTLAGDCARARRVAEPASTFAATLSTNNTKWGDAAVLDWRNGLTKFIAEMQSCEQNSGALAGGEAVPAGPRVAAVAQRADEAVVAYQWTEQALLKTLKINLDVRRNLR